MKTANDGDEAIALVECEQFDLAVLDIKMPAVDSFEVLLFIKKRFPLMKVIMLTGFADLMNAIKSKKLGADDFLGKPCDLHELFAIIQQHMQPIALLELKEA